MVSTLPHSGLSLYDDLKEQIMGKVRRKEIQNEVTLDRFSENDPEALRAFLWEVE